MMNHQNIDSYAVGDAILGRWQVRAIAGGHGKSGMGIVYIADDRESGRAVAIKTFQPELVSNVEIKQLLLHEANVWLEMGSHPNIVSVERVEVVGSQPLIVMDYVAPDANGRNCLRDYLGGALQSEKTLSNWALQICAALAHMRACGIEVHRDLKPDNIMITSDGEAKVTDFGLARAFDGLTVASSLSIPHGPGQVTGMVGTPGYIAPEVVLGHRADIRSDVYCFGLLLAQAITGSATPPLTGPKVGDWASFEQSNLQIRSRTAPPTSHSILHGVISRCLQFEPANRYPHFPALADAIQLASAGREQFTARHQAADRDQALNQAIAKVFSLRNLGRLEEALDMIRGLRRDHVASPELLDVEGLVRSATGDVDRAIELHEAACELVPDNPVFRNNLGVAYREAKRLDAACEQFAKSLDLGNRSAGAWANLAVCELDSGRYDRAVFSFDHALALDPHFVDAHRGRAESLHRLGRTNEALQALQQVLDIEPENADVLERMQQFLGALK